MNKFEESVNLVASNIHRLPPFLKSKLEYSLIQERVEELGNKALVSLGTDIKQYFETNPVESFMLKNALETASIALGYRLVDDTLISQAIRVVEKDSKSLFYRVFHPLNKTGIVKEIENLSVKLEALKLEVKQVELVNIKLKELGEIVIQNAKNEGNKTLSEANKKAESTIAKAYASQKEILSEADKKADKVVKEAKRDLLLLNTSIKSKESHIKLLDNKIRELTLLSEQLLKNPEIKEKWNRDKAEMLDTDEKLLRHNLKVKLEVPNHFEFQTFLKFLEDITPLIQEKEEFKLNYGEKRLTTIFNDSPNDFTVFLDWKTCVQGGLINHRIEFDLKDILNKSVDEFADFYKKILKLSKKEVFIDFDSSVSKEQLEYESLLSELEWHTSRRHRHVPDVVLTASNAILNSIADIKRNHKVINDRIKGSHFVFETDIGKQINEIFNQHPYIFFGSFNRRMLRGNT